MSVELMADGNTSACCASPFLVPASFLVPVLGVLTVRVPCAYCRSCGELVSTAGWFAETFVMPWWEGEAMVHDPDCPEHGGSN